MIDARGLSCPEPVTMIKKAIATHEAQYDMLVDSRVALENVTRFAQYAGYSVDYTEDQGTFTIKIRKNADGK